MIADASQLYRSPNALAAHYERFRVAERLLLTGHSHQAWPDRAEIGQRRAFDDAAEHVDAKWERAFERAGRVRAGFARLLDTSPETVSLGTSTHDLLVKWLSALPLRERPCVVTTDAEFHSARRQLARLEEEGLRVLRVSARPADSVGERLAAAIDDRVAGVITSTVFYQTAEIAGALDLAAVACEKHGASLLLDAYHQLNVVPFSLRSLGLESAFVTGGGYKYCQLGEGNCFLRSPPGCTLRPRITGWFAEFAELDAARSNTVSYGARHERFAGASYDPTSHYRAAEVFDFFAEMGLTPELLREVSQYQVALLRAAIDALEPRPDILKRPDLPLARLGGFLALESPRASEIQRELGRRGILADARGNHLRLGPAPYLSDEQLYRAVAGVEDVMKALR
jgi:kynureninase